MIGGRNLLYVRLEPPLAECTSTAAVTQLTITLLSSVVHVQRGLRDFGTSLYRLDYISRIIVSSNILHRLMIPRRVPRAISPSATLRRAYTLSTKDNSHEVPFCCFAVLVWRYAYFSIRESGIEWECPLRLKFVNGHFVSKLQSHSCDWLKLC